MKYKCLVFDHDDTVVDSTKNVHYPSYIAYMKDKYPERIVSIEDYMIYNFNPGVIEFFTQIQGLSMDECKEEEKFWKEFASKRTSKSFEYMKQIMEEHKKQGGIIAVVSHSYRENILRDYEYNHLPTPDIIFGWEQPLEERKPSPVPLLKIMEKYNLKPEELLMIDDLKPGCDMAKKANVPFAAACWAFNIPENRKYMNENADFVFESVEELKNHLGY